MFAAIAVVLWPGALALSVAAFAYAAVAGVLMTLGMLSFYRALAAAPVSVVSPVSSAYPLVTAAVAAGLGAPLSAREALGIVAVVGGVGLASGVPTGTRGLLPAMGAAIAWGVGTAVVDLAVEASSWQAATLVELVAGTLVFGALPRGARPGRAALARRALWLGAAAQQSAEAVFNLGLAHSGSPAVVGALSACYPAVTVVLAIRGFGERPHAGALSGALLTIVGVAVLAG
jgi:drug/metabolite transporter (DMT)-like permease